MRSEPIVALAPNVWTHGTPKNRQYLLSRLGLRGWHITYSIGPMSVWGRRTAEWREAPLLGRFIRKDGVNLDQAGRLAATWPRFSLWDRLTREHHARRLTRSAGEGWGRGGIAFLFHPKYWPYVQALKPRYVVFHAYDAFPLMDKNWSELDASYLANLSQRADILSATTPGVVATFPVSCQSKARILENGADVGKFRAAEHLECPEALRAIPRPRIGYIGTVSRRTDFASINYVARKHPDWHWILLGDVVEYAIADDPSVLRDYQASRTLPNVHYLDAVPSDDVVAYMGHMDINTICYRVSKQNWVSMGYPVKLHEYFAVGKPVVSAPLEIIRDRFASAVELASSPSEWESAIENVLSTGGRGSRDLRLSISEANSWDQRVDQLEGWLFEMLRSPHTSTPAS